MRMAERLGKLPGEIDAMPYRDYCDLLAVWGAEDDHAKQQRAVRGRRS